MILTFFMSLTSPETFFFLGSAFSVVILQIWVAALTQAKNHAIVRICTEEILGNLRR